MADPAIEQKANEVIQDCHRYARAVFPNTHSGAPSVRPTPYGYQMIAMDGAGYGVILSQCLDAGGSDNFKHGLANKVKPTSRVPAKG